MTPTLDIRYLVIVKAKAGLVIRDRPAPEGAGAARRREEPVGAQLLAYRVLKFDGVPYAMLVPRDPSKPEWCRMEEADGSIVYAESLPFEEPAGNELVAAIRYLADAIRSYGRA